MASKKSMADKIFLDTNIALEIFLVRARKQKVLAIIAELEQDGLELCVSSLSVSHFMYFVELENKPKPDAYNFIRQFPILDVNEIDVGWACANDQGDFEDALQVACALRHGCKKFITLDQDLKKRHQKHIFVTLIR